MAEPSALGHIIEGVVERDPLTGRLQIMDVGPDGKAKVTDIETLVGRYAGKEVRLTLASFEGLAELAELVEGQGAGAGRVFGVLPEELPGVSFAISRRNQ